ncbi:MAG: hypothetical protein ACYTF9_07345 [Planctomycetota bacterium]|jgi:hypothetical protein
MTHRVTDLDRAARLAAGFIHTGRAGSLHEAISIACEENSLDGQRPGAGRVRQHLQLMAMQAMGEAAYREAHAALERSLEELLTGLVELSGGQIRPLLVGRAAEGLTDGPGALHVRLYTTLSVAELAALLEDLECEVELETVDTAVGRLNRLYVVDDELVVALTRCPVDMHIPEDADMFSGRPLRTATLEDLRARLG